MREVCVGYTLWPATFELSDARPWLDEAEAHGVDMVEVPLFTTRAIVGGRVHSRAAAHLAHPFAGRPFGVTAHAMLTINLMDAADRIPEHERVLAANIELCERLGARRLVVHCGLAAPGDDVEAAYARQRASLAAMADLAAGAGVTLCLETIWSFDGRATALPSRLAREIEAIGHPNLRATLDYAHSLLQSELEGADFHAEIRAIAPHAVHIHLNDCFGVGSGVKPALPAEAVAYGAGDLHLPIGWGAIPWDRVLTEPDYPPGEITLNQELHPTFWHALADDVAEMRRLAALMTGAAHAPKAAAR